MNPQSILQAGYLDILFLHRNKQYGSYELRTHYNARAGKGAVIAVSLALLAFGLPAIVNGRSDNGNASAMPGKILDTHITSVAPDKPKLAIAIKATQAAATAPTVTALPTIVVPDQEVLTPPKPNDSLEGRQIGAADNAGTGGTAPDLGLPIGPGNPEGPATGDDGPAIAAVPEKPFVYVEQLPEFSGLNEYLSRNLRYPAQARTDEIEGKVIVHFVVNEDGSISDATVAKSINHLLDNEALRVVGAMPRWKPGRQNGQAVKVYYDLPITFVLD